MTSADLKTGIVPATTEALAGELARLLSPAAVVRVREPLAKRTTLRVGGPADVYAEPGGEADLRVMVRFAAERRLPLLVLGRGSNLLVRDGGWRGLVVSLAHPCFCAIELTEEGGRLRCGGGARLKAVANFAKQHSLGGLEFLEGIPGSLGGALRMNAGAMGSSIFDRVISVRFMDLAGVTGESAPGQLGVGYRHCPGLRDRIVLDAVLQGAPAPREEIEERMNQYNRKRWSTQPAAPSAGCMFKNPAGIPAGRLIEELGLKGTRIGGARISLEHGNFIVNEGGATARDVCRLIELIRERARAERGVELETEVEMVGSDE
ncbi:MAG TPA: UDP-N-acetylmuramate dehydrogenase [Verrucomicrobiota bacterium]|nr:UDP-N-acetylmuramate dehydrogenase [Verrucomicrobiota bacterium]HRT08875.1 UDP-N-acetylmuramate dehydrogenase [Candidatus Paceibacterota bacterium]HRT56547.1 UDP-N-acetylmuramate dehydrogenase [Candidatus Paceibacterota bacterium]